MEYDEFEGQTKGFQINGLKGVLSDSGLWMVNTMFTKGTSVWPKELQAVSRIGSMTDVERDELMGELAVGIHWGCLVNDDVQGLNQDVSLILCSGLPLGGYARAGVNLDDAEALGRLVQDGMQEATIHAGAWNQVKFGVSDVVLTTLGTGVFGHPVDWVVAARNRALDLVPCSLDVLQFHFSRREPEFDY